MAGPRVIYIMGAGRSGSTILGVTLGNCDGVFFAGELDKWLRREGRPRISGEERERFWEGVREHVPAAGKLFGEDARLCHRYLERSSGLLRPGRLARARGLRPRYREFNRELYEAIAAAAQATHVVDSSHYPLRARELQRVEGIELHVLFLVRDPRSVVASFAREDVVERRFNAPTTNVYLWLTYLLSLLVFARQPRARRLLVRHEDFLRDPERVLGQILRGAGSDAPAPELGALRTGFPLVGNRLIEQEQVALRSGEPPAPARSRLTSVMQLPMRLVLARVRPTTAAGA